MDSMYLKYNINHTNLDSATVNSEHSVPATIFGLKKFSRKIL